MDVFDLIKEGWSAAAIPYRRVKDESLTLLPVAVKQNQRSVLNATEAVLELGCGSGYPMAKYIYNSLHNANIEYPLVYCTAANSMTPIIYHGIDISETQIQLAREENPLLSDNFEVAEMLSYCSKQQSESLCGVICLFALFHLPRSNHVDLFTSIFRSLKKGAPLLFTVSDKAHEGFEEDWLGARKMYWSIFSPFWYELTLSELGFELLTKFKEDKMFLGERETTWCIIIIVSQFIMFDC